MQGDREEGFPSRLCDQGRSVEGFRKWDGKATVEDSRGCRHLPLETKKSLLAAAKSHLVSDVNRALCMAYRPAAYYIP